MPHSIFVGSFAALEKRWIEDVIALRREDALSEINVLVGSNVLAAYLKRRLAASGHAVANVRFHTFLELAKRLAIHAGAADDRPGMPELGGPVMLESVLASQTPDVFAPLSEFPGFRNALLETFRDLRDAEIEPAKLESTLRTIGEAKDRRRHLEALSDLYRRYRAATAAFHDVDDYFRTAISGCTSGARKLGMRQMMIYGIYDVTGQQASFLSALKNSVGMTYFVPYAEESTGEFARPFLENLSLELDVRPVGLEDPEPESELQRLAAEGFGLSPVEGPEKQNALLPDGSYSLVSVPGESRLAVEVVRELVRAVRDGVIAGFEEAAVVLHQPETDLHVLEEALRLRGIPCYIHGGLSFADSVLSKAVLAIVDLPLRAFQREALLAAMELTAACLEDTEGSQWDVQRWKALTNDARFLSGERVWDNAIHNLVTRLERSAERAEKDRGDPEADEDEEEGSGSSAGITEKLQTARSLQKAWRIVRGATGSWPAELSWKGWTDLLLDRLEPLFGHKGDWSQLVAVLDRVGSLGSLGTELQSLVALREALAGAMRSMSRSVGHLERTGVNILSTSAARGLRFPLVIVPGLDEGRFPAKPRQDPFLLDSERRHFSRLPLKKKRLEEEKLLFDMAARSAAKRLVLMTSRLEEASDRERIPSQFFLRTAAAICGGSIATRELAPDTVPGFRSVSLDNPAPAPGEPAVDEGEIRLRLVTAGQYPSRVALSVLAGIEPARFERALSYDTERWQRFLTAFDGFLEDPELRLHMTGTLPSYHGQVSASRLETYARCPYLYFLKYGLELEAWEEPGALEDVDPLMRGLAVHEVLERFLKERGGSAFETPVEDMRQALFSLAEEVLERYRPYATAELLWEIERDNLFALLARWLDFEKERADEGLSPARLEQVFGEFPDEELFPAFRIRTKNHCFDFRGRIDRIDLSPDGKRARVTDYKTGSRPQPMASKSRPLLMGGERMQLAIYRGALSVLEAFQSVQSVQGEYLFLQPKDRRVVESAFSGEDLEHATGLLAETLEILGDSLDSGLFFARTSGTVRPYGHCDYCEYLTICGKDRMQREERKADDPRVRDFMRITEIA